MIKKIMRLLLYLFKYLCYGYIKKIIYIENLINDNKGVEEDSATFTDSYFNTSEAKALKSIPSKFPELIISKFLFSHSIVFKLESNKAESV